MDRRQFIKLSIFGSLKGLVRAKNIAQKAAIRVKAAPNPTRRQFLRDTVVSTAGDVVDPAVKGVLAAGVNTLKNAKGIAAPAAGAAMVAGNVPNVTRRQFLKRLGGATATGVVAGKPLARAAASKVNPGVVRQGAFAAAGTSKLDKGKKMLRRAQDIASAETTTQKMQVGAKILGSSIKRSAETNPAAIVGKGAQNLVGKAIMMGM